MRIVSLISFPSGGPYTWARQLEKELQKRGIATRFYAGRKDYLRALKDKHDIVHTCVPLPFLRCEKYILTIHGNYMEEKAVVRPLFKRLIGKANVITTPSLFLKNKLAIGNAVIIPNGIDLPEETKKSYDLIKSNPTVGILTNFNFRPKTEGLINLAKIIESISQEIKITIGGSGEFFEEYKQKILEIHPNTEFLGHCQKEDLFDKIDIFAYYSNLDNQPLAVLEAMAFGLPVMSNVVGSTPEILTGKLENYIARSDEDYKKILEKLLSSETARVENGGEAKKISQNFSWDKVVKRFVEIYEK